MAKKKSHWINLPIFWKVGSIIAIIAGMAYLYWAFIDGFDRLDLAIMLLWFIAVTGLQIEYLLFKYFEHKKIDARWW